MSPVSHGRKPKKAPRSEADDLLARVVREVGRELIELDDPLQAELCVSDLAGSWWKEIDEPGAGEAVGSELIRFAGSRRSPGALALLRGLALLGSPRQRELAAAAADKLATRGVSEPGWAASAGRWTPTATWAYGDVFGDQVSIGLEFEQAGHAPHAVVVLVDHGVDGIAKDAFVAAEPDEVRHETRGLADSPTTWFRELPPAEARALLEPAFAATDAADLPPVGDTFREIRALAMARLRTLPEPPVVLRPAPVPEAERAALVEEFLAAAAPTGDRADVAFCARLLVDDACDHGGARPLRVGPGLLGAFLLDRVHDIELTDEQEAALPDVVQAWADWAGERTGLSDAARAELAAAVEEILEAFADPDDLGPLGFLLDDVLDDLQSPEELEDVLARRLLVVPLGSPDDLAGIDPSDPDERGLLIRDEHPEYRAVLDDPAADLAADGTNPRLHVAVHEIVANQLWDDDPPEAWAAAQRLLDQGVGRHDVLHALGEVVLRHLHGALTGRAPVDVDALRADYDALGRKPRRG